MRHEELASNPHTDGIHGDRYDAIFFEND